MDNILDDFELLVLEATKSLYPDGCVKCADKWCKYDADIVFPLPCENAFTVADEFKDLYGEGCV